MSAPDEKWCRGDVWTDLNVGVIDVSVPEEGSPEAKVSIMSPDGVVRLSAEIDLSPTPKHRYDSATWFENDSESS